MEKYIQQRRRTS